MFRRHASSSAAAWFFVAGGFLVETLVMLLVGGLLRDTGDLATVVLGASTALLVVYIAGDMVASGRARKPYGDVGVLWEIQPAATVLFLLLVLAARASAALLL